MKNLVALLFFCLSFQAMASSKSQSFYIKLKKSEIETDSKAESHRITLSSKQIKIILDDEHPLNCALSTKLKGSKSPIDATITFSIDLGDGDYSPFGLYYSGEIFLQEELKAALLAPFSSPFKINSLATSLLLLPYQLSSSNGEEEMAAVVFGRSIKAVDSFLATAGDEWDKKNVFEAVINAKKEVKGVFNCTLRY